MQILLDIVGFRVVSRTPDSGLPLTCAALRPTQVSTSTAHLQSSVISILAKFGEVKSV